METDSHRGGWPSWLRLAPICSHVRITPASLLDLEKSYFFPYDQTQEHLDFTSTPVRWCATSPTQNERYFKCKIKNFDPWSSRRAPLPKSPSFTQRDTIIGAGGNDEPTPRIWRAVHSKSAWPRPLASADDQKTEALARASTCARLADKWFKSEGIREGVSGFYTGLSIIVKFIGWGTKE